MTNTTTDQDQDLAPMTTEKLSAKACLYIVGALGAGMLLGMQLISSPMQAQIDGYKELADGWKKHALAYKAVSEENAGYANRWQLQANKALDLAERCTALK